MCMMCMMMHAMDHSSHDGKTAHAIANQNESLFDILRRRYALGEITREQFEEMRRVLGFSGDAATVLSSAEREHH